MKQQLRLGSESITLTNKSFGRAYLQFQLVTDTTAGTDNDTNLDLSKVRISIDLKQGGVRETSSFNGVGPVALEILKAVNPLYQSDINFANTGLTCQGAQVFAISGTSDLRLVKIPLLWGGYQLKADDSLTFNIDQIPGLYNAACTAGSTAYLVIEEASDINQSDINLPYYFPITADKNSPSFSLKGTSEVMLLSSTRTTQLSDAIFTSAEIRSSHVNDRFDLYTLSQLRFDKQITSSPANIYESTNIYNVEPSALSEVQVDLGINSTQVVDGAQFLFTSKVLFSPEIAMRAIAHSNKVTQRKLNLRGLGKRQGFGVSQTKSFGTGDTTDAKRAFRGY
jgi:hypothetical protein